jgi:hypothetical protein
MVRGNIVEWWIWCRGMYNVCAFICDAASSVWTTCVHGVCQMYVYLSASIYVASESNGNVVTADYCLVCCLRYHNNSSWYILLQSYIYIMMNIYL